MKKTDIAMIILVASASVMISYFVVSSLPMFSAAEQEATVKVAEEISPDVVEPDTSVFNDMAINPTVEVIIGEGDAEAQPSTQSGSADTQQPDTTEQ